MKIEMLIVSEIKKENSEHWERKTKKKDKNTFLFKKVKKYRKDMEHKTRERKRQR